MLIDKRSLQKLFKHRSGRIGCIFTLMFLACALFAPWLAPYDAAADQVGPSLSPPQWSDSSFLIFGSDFLGRDLFSRIIFGTRISLGIGMVAVLVGASIGIPLGMISAYTGGIVDRVMMRVCDILLAFPPVLLAVCVVAILGPSLENAMLAVGIVGMPTYARIVRAGVLCEKEREYVNASRALGAPALRILFLEIFPNVTGPLLVVMSLHFATAVMEAASLSYLGLGAQPPQPEWGALLLDGKDYFFEAWWLMVFPGIAILITVLGFNLMGDGLRDVFDPKA